MIRQREVVRVTGGHVARWASLRLLIASLALWAPVHARAATVTVSSTGDTVAVDGAVTLREAIQSVNAGANINADVVAAGSYGANDTIAFDITGGCATPCTITLASLLGNVDKAVTIDGYTQSGASANTLTVGDNAVIKIEIDGNTIVSNDAILALMGGSTTLRGLNLHGGAGAAIAINSSNNVVEGCFIGTNPAGTAGASTNGNGITIFFGAGGEDNNRIGGTLPAQRNLISGNLIAIVVTSEASNTLIAGNYIGTNAAGTAALGNVVGVDAGGALSGPLTIGGTAPGAGNLISGNTDLGIEIGEFGTGPIPVTIQGNLIGVDATGMAALGNGGFGIEIQAFMAGPVVLIGGTAAGAGNVISGNGFSHFGGGILTQAGNVTIQGNLIGTNAAGTAGIGNFASGVDANGGNSFYGFTVVGGSSPAARNVISANGADGVRVEFSIAIVQGNFIGTAADGTTPLGNFAFGVRVDSGAATIGGTGAGEGNLIANNARGVNVLIGFPAIRNAASATILGNSISHDSELGIDLGNDLVTPNDPGDADTGANDLQNFPVLTMADISAGNVTLKGTLNSTVDTLFRLEFFSNTACHTSGFGEGQTFLGFINMLTNGLGNASFGPISFPVPVGQTIFTATATVTTGVINPPGPPRSIVIPTSGTSEFSQCFQETTDANPPLCTAVLHNGPPPFFTGSGEDDRPSEDTNGNGLLDPGEDLNGNNRIDIDTGIAGITLAAGAVNLTVTPDPFVAGDGVVGFRVDQTTSGFPAVGDVVVADGAGNTCSERVQLGTLDPSGGIIHTPQRNLRLMLGQSSPDVTGVRCIEPSDPNNPDFDTLPSTMFFNGTADIDLVLSAGNGTKTVCCEYESMIMMPAPVNTAISPPFCDLVILESTSPTPTDTPVESATPAPSDTPTVTPTPTASATAPPTNTPTSTPTLSTHENSAGPLGCSDGIDNDGDGHIDCADADCANVAPCAVVAPVLSPGMLLLLVAVLTMLGIGFSWVRLRSV